MWQNAHKPVEINLDSHPKSSKLFSSLSLPSIERARGKAELFIILAEEESTFLTLEETKLFKSRWM